MLTLFHQAAGFPHSALSEELHPAFETFGDIYALNVTPPPLSPPLIASPSAPAARIMRGLFCAVDIGPANRNRTWWWVSGMMGTPAERGELTTRPVSASHAHTGFRPSLVVPVSLGLTLPPRSRLLSTTFGDLATTQHVTCGAVAV